MIACGGYLMEAQHVAEDLVQGFSTWGYMYPWGCICLSEGVHLRLAIEGKTHLCIIYFQRVMHMSVNIIFKNHCLLPAKYINFET